MRGFFCAHYFRVLPKLLENNSIKIFAKLCGIKCVAIQWPHIPRHTLFLSHDSYFQACVAHTRKTMLRSASDGTDARDQKVTSKHD